MKNGMFVKEVAELCGVSVRLLHHWDFIGLVSPSERLPNGYRLYLDDDIKRIQQALLYRATGMRLEHIKELLDSRQDDKQHLEMQLALLEEASLELNRKIKAVHQLLEECIMGNELSIEEKAALMGKDWLPEWEDEAKDKWGDTPDWQETQIHLSQMSKDDWQTYRLDIQLLEEKMADLCIGGTPADSEEALQLIEEYRILSSKHHFEITYPKHVLISRLYTEDERFKAYYDKYSPKLAAWIQHGIEANARAHGVDPESAKWE